MKTVEILNEENLITITDGYEGCYETSVEVFPETKIFKIDNSVTDDCINHYQTYEYKISSDPIEMRVRLIESYSRTPEYSISVKDGVVLEAEGRTDLRKQVEWSKIELFGNYEINLFILSKHPEIISHIEYRKLLRTTEQRINAALAKIEQTIKEKDNKGLEIFEGEYGKTIRHADEKKSKKWSENEEGNLYKQLFESESPNYCGISQYEFSESSNILKHIDNLLNPKETSSPESMVDKKKNYGKWLGYALNVTINLVTIGVVLGIYSKLYEDFEIIVTSILILIYLSLQSYFMVYSNGLLGLSTEFKRIRKLLKDEPSKEEKEMDKNIGPAMMKMYINAGFSSIIYLIALFHLFGAL